MKRLLLVILQLLVIFGYSQNTWQKLPEPKVIPAKKYVCKAVITSAPKTNQKHYLNPVFTDEFPTFVSIVKPDTLPQIRFNSFYTTTKKLVDFPPNLFFKDVADANIKYIDKNKGLLSNAISSITEDVNGLIYFSSAEGLMCFNGTNCQIIEGTAEFPLKFIEKVFTTKQGKTWVATDRGIAYLENRKLYVADLKIDGTIINLNQTNNGDLIVSTKKMGVFVVQKNKTLHYSKGLSVHHVSDAIETKNNTFWIGYVTKGIAFIRNDSLFEYKRDGEIGTATTFLEDNNQVWIGSQMHNPYLFKNDSLFNIYLNKGNVNFTSHCIIKTSKGIWFSRYGLGVNLIKNNNEVIAFTENNGLVDRNAFSVFSDSQENIWVSSLYKGISRIDENIIYSVKDEIKGNISDLETDLDGNIWYFKNGGQLTKESTIEFAKYVNESKAETPGSYHAVSGFTNKNQVWTSNYESGVAKLENNVYTFYKTNSDYFDNSIVSLEPDSYDGGVWCNTLNNRLIKLLNDTFYDYSQSKQWGQIVFTGLQRLNNGVVCAFTKNNGIFLLHQNKFIPLNKFQPKLPKSTYLIYVNSNKKYVYLSDGEIHFQKKNYDIITLKNKVLENNTIFSIEEINPHLYFAATSRGIIEISINKNSVDFTLFDHSINNNITSVKLIKKINGEILLLGENGISTYDSYFKYSKNLKPKLSLNNYSYNDTTYYKYDKKLVIEQDVPLNITFNNVLWGNRSLLLYAVKKGNKISRWQTQYQNEINLSQLSYGDYELIVYAVSADKKSNPISLKIEVLPYWYQTIWFKSIIGLLLFGSVLLFLYFKRKQALKIQIELQKKVTEKTFDLVTEKKIVLKQLNEKELLLKELNHRVKNNFQMVSSLLELQSSYSNDEEIKCHLAIGINRIKSLAIAHQALYNKENINDIDLKHYLNAIISNLFIDKNNFANLEMEDEYFIDIEKAQSIGFVINELITNSIKHAWTTSNKKKSINIVIRKSDKITTITYTDNGVGFSSGFDFKNTNSLGITLINSFVSRNLLGNIEMSSNNGVVVLITFNN